MGLRVVAPELDTKRRGPCTGQKHAPEAHQRRPAPHPATTSVRTRALLESVSLVCTRRLQHNGIASGGPGIGHEKARAVHRPKTRAGGAPAPTSTAPSHHKCANASPLGVCELGVHATAAAQWDCEWWPRNWTRKGAGRAPAKNTRRRRTSADQHRTQPPQVCEREPSWSLRAWCARDGCSTTGLRVVAPELDTKRRGPCTGQKHAPEAHQRRPAPHPAATSVRTRALLEPASVVCTRRLQHNG